MEEMKHDRFLFLGEDGQHMHFYMPPCEERARIKPLVEHGGGVINSKITQDAIRLAVKGQKLHSDDYVDVTFVTDCVKENKIVDIEKYRLKSGSVGGGKVVLSESTILDDAEGTSNHVLSLNAKQRSGRSKYLLSEDKAILSYLLDECAYNAIRGNIVWVEMEALKITKHTWQSMKDHFRRVILPQIHKYQLTGHEVALLSGTLNVASVTPESESKKSPGKTSLGPSSLSPSGRNSAKKRLFSREEDEQAEGDKAKRKNLAHVSPKRRRESGSPSEGHESPDADNPQGEITDTTKTIEDAAPSSDDDLDDLDCMLLQQAASSTSPGKTFRRKSPQISTDQEQDKTKNTSRTQTKNSTEKNEDVREQKQLTKAAEAVTTFESRPTPGQRNEYGNLESDDSSASADVFPELSGPAVLELAQVSTQLTQSESGHELHYMETLEQLDNGESQSLLSPSRKQPKLGSPEKTAVGSESPKISTEKRGRGRPRKVKPAIKENLAQDPNIDTTSDKPAQEENVTVKRNRGRFCKVWPPIVEDPEQGSTPDSDTDATSDKPAQEENGLEEVSPQLNHRGQSLKRSATADQQCLRNFIFDTAASQPELIERCVTTACHLYPARLWRERNMFTVTYNSVDVSYVASQPNSTNPALDVDLKQAKYKQTAHIVKGICEWLGIEKEELLHVLWTTSGVVSDAIDWILNGNTDAVWSRKEDALLQGGDEAACRKLIKKFGTAAVDHRTVFLEDNLHE